MKTKIDYADFKSLWQVAYRYSDSRGLIDKQLREDFAQEYCLAVWLGKHNSLRFQYANFMRKIYGRIDEFATDGPKKKSLALRSMKTLKNNQIYHLENNNPLDILEDKLIKKSLLEKISSLPKNKRLTIFLHYFCNVSLLEISKRLKLCHSRISQIHNEALRDLRENLIDN